MNAEQARAIVDAEEGRDRALLNLRNLTQQPMDSNNPEYPLHEQRVAEAGESYAAAQARVEELMIHHKRGTPVDAATLGAFEGEDVSSVAVGTARIETEHEVREPTQIEAPKRKPGRPRKNP